MLTALEPFAFYSFTRVGTREHFPVRKTCPVSFVSSHSPGPELVTPGEAGKRANYYVPDHAITIYYCSTFRQDTTSLLHRARLVLVSSFFSLFLLFREHQGSSFPSVFYFPSVMGTIGKGSTRVAKKEENEG